MSRSFVINLLALTPALKGEDDESLEDRAC